MSWRKLWKAAALCSILVSLCFFTVAGQTKSLLDKRISISMERQSLGRVIYHLIENEGLAFGLEESTFDQSHNDFEFEPNLMRGPDPDHPERASEGFYYSPPKFEVRHGNWITVKMSDATVAAVLDVIVGQMKNYTWELNENVINIIPVRGRDPRFKKLLELRVSKFDLPKHDLAVGMLHEKIRAVPEFKQFFKENQFVLDDFRPNRKGELMRELPDTFHFSDLTFRQLLNKITAEKKGGWILRESKTQVRENDDIDLVL